MDARIEGQYTHREAMKVANLALKCLSAEPKTRPNMEEVVRELEQLQACSSDTASSVAVSSVDGTVKSSHSSSTSSSGANNKKDRKSSFESLNGEGTSTPTPYASPLRT